MLSTPCKLQEKTAPEPFMRLVLVRFRGGQGLSSPVSSHSIVLPNSRAILSKISAPISALWWSALDPQRLLVQQKGGGRADRRSAARQTQLSNNSLPLRHRVGGYRPIPVGSEVAPRSAPDASCWYATKQTLIPQAVGGAWGPGSQGPQQFGFDVLRVHRVRAQYLRT